MKTTMYVDPAWRLPEGFKREFIGGPDMDDYEMSIAHQLEKYEEKVMNKMKNKECKLVRKLVRNGVVMGVQFGEDKRPTTLLDLTPTLVVFAATHLDRESRVKEIYGGGYFEKFCEEYYDTRTTDIFKKLVPEEVWNKHVNAAKTYVMGHYHSLCRQ